MKVKCKNCNHKICIQGEFENQEVSHVNMGEGAENPCHCGCEKAERKRKPVFCKNCKAEICKRKGELLHIDTYDSGTASGRPGMRLRLGNVCSLRTGCSNPQPDSVMRRQKNGKA